MINTPLKNTIEVIHLMRKRQTKILNIVQTVEDVGKLIHYQDFPTYKKKRKTCSFCTKKNKGVHVV